MVPIGDNYFSALNSAVFTDGSFCYIPPNTICPLDLSTYFRINDQSAGQFERTLIIAEKNSKVNYFLRRFAQLLNMIQINCMLQLLN